MSGAPVPVCYALSRALGSRREEYNQRFVQMRRQQRDLDGGLLQGFLREALDPTVATLAELPAWNADRIDALVSVAFDAALELCAQRLLAPGANRTLLARAWQQPWSAVLARWPHWPAQVPLAALCNAVFHLGQAEGARADVWLDRMAQVLPHLAQPEEWLAAGQAAAWLCGLAQYREAALDRLAQLPPTAAQQLLGLTPDRPLRAELLKLRAQPWFDLSAPSASAKAPQVRRWVGAFRGYGGAFEQPPLLAVHEDQLYVSSAGASWLLLADAFGHHLARVPQAVYAQAARRRAALPLSVRLDGESLHFATGKLAFEDRGGLATVVATSTTLAISFHASHRIALVPLP